MEGFLTVYKGTVHKPSNIFMSQLLFSTLKFNQILVLLQL